MLRPNLNFQIVRLSADDVSGGLAAIDALWKRLSPQNPINRDFMDELFERSYETFARINQVFAGLALVAVSIAVIGLFGMAVQVARRRVHEIGVRKSVGARSGQIVAMLLRDFAKPVLIANLIAWPFAYFAAQQYLNVFIQRMTLTPLPFVLSLVIAVAIACIAVSGQALRAARVSPATVLRFE
jgi:putative ABC transport system permease protein